MTEEKPTMRDCQVAEGVRLERWPEQAPFMVASYRQEIERITESRVQREMAELASDEKQAMMDMVNERVSEIARLHGLLERADALLPPDEMPEVHEALQSCSDRYEAMRAEKDARIAELVAEVVMLRADLTLLHPATGVTVDLTEIVDRARDDERLRHEAEMRGLRETIAQVLRDAAAVNKRIEARDFVQEETDIPWFIHWVSLARLAEWSAAHPEPERENRNMLRNTPSQIYFKSASGPEEAAEANAEAARVLEVMQDAWIAPHYGSGVVAISRDGKSGSGSTIADAVRDWERRKGVAKEE